jgi:hypothetical protein
VGLALSWYRLRLGVKVLQRQGEAEYASGEGASAKYEVAQPSDRALLSTACDHRIVIGMGFDLLN